MTNLTFKANVHDFASAVAFLNGKESRKLAHNTWVERLPTVDGREQVGIRYHATYIVKYRLGQVILNTGGWNTSTTTMRLHHFAPAGYRVNLSKGETILTHPNGYYEYLSSKTLDN